MRRRLRSALSWSVHPLRFPPLALALVAAAVYTLAIRLDSVQGDTWWALRAGQEMWHTHRPITTDTYSYTAYGRPWPDHAWLYQVVLYAAYVVGKFPLVSVINAALAAGAILLARPRGPAQWADVVATTPVIALASLNWSVRPQVMSLFLLAVMVRLIHRERWRTIVVLMLLWANLHGEVVLGGLLLGAASFAGLLHWLIGRRRRPEDEDRAARRRFLACALTTIVAAGATLINPLGVGLWRYLASANSRPGQGMIAEWQPSWTAPEVTAWFWLWCGVLVLVLVVRWRRLWQWPIFLDICLTLSIAPLAWMSMRNISAFGIVSLPLLIGLLRRQGPPRPVRPGSLMPGGRIMVALAVVAAIVSTTRTLEHPVDLAWTPMSSTAAAAIEACPGQVYTTYNSGAYLIWFARSKRVFVDNRQDPYDEATLTFGPGQKDWQQVFRRYGVRCAAINVAYDTPYVVVFGALMRAPVRYADEQWVIFEIPPKALG